MVRQEHLELLESLRTDENPHTGRTLRERPELKPKTCWKIGKILRTFVSLDSFTASTAHSTTRSVLRQTPIVLISPR